LIGLGILAGAVFVLVVALRASGQLKTYVTPSASMSPTIRCGDHIAVVPYHSGGPRRGDVVVARIRGPFGGTQAVVKRVIGVGGDRIEFRDLHVWVNGRMADHAITDTGRNETVAAGSYYLLGDNREISDDSRDFGDVQGSAVIGHAVAVYWPLGHAGTISHTPPAQPGGGPC
jgi:signal peptidase I